MMPGENRSRVPDQSQYRGDALKGAPLHAQPLQRSPAGMNLETLPESPQFTQLTATSVQSTVAPSALFHLNKWAIAATSGVLLLILVIGVVTLWSAGFKANVQSKQPASSYDTRELSFRGLSTDPILQVTEAAKLSINGELQVGSTFVLTPTNEPTIPKTGQIYYSKLTNTPYIFDGSSFKSMMDVPAVQSLGGITGAITLGNGLQLSGSQLVLSAAVQQSIGARVTTIQGQSGDINLIPGTGIAVNGTTISNTGVTKVLGASGLSVTQAAGTVTIGLPQLLGTNDTPLFAGVQLNSALGVTYGGTGLSTGQITANAVMITNSDGSAYELVAPSGSSQCLIGDPLDNNKIKFGACSSSSSTGINGITDGDGITADGDVVLKPVAGSPLTVTTVTSASIDTISLGLQLRSNYGLAIDTASPYGLGLQACTTSNEILKWNGAGWACGTDDTGTDTNTTYAAGNGIALTANSFSVNLQGGAGVSSGLTVDSTGLAIQNCSIDGNVLKYTAAAGWTCAGDNAGTGDGQGITALGNYLVSTDANYDTGTAGAYTNGTTIFLQAASGTGAGIVTTAVQTFAGAKTFNTKATFSAAGTGLEVTNNATVGGTLSATGSISGAGLSVTGDAIFQNTGATDTLLTADTTNNRIVIGNATGIGANTTTLVLDAAASDPTGVVGAMYYNTASNVFRCYTTGWFNCSGTGVSVASGSGNDTKLAKFNSTGQLTDSSLAESGTTLTYAGNTVINAASGFSGNLLDLKVDVNSMLKVNQAGDVTGGKYNTATISGGTLSSVAVNGLAVSDTAVTGTGGLTIGAGGTNQNLVLQATGSGVIQMSSSVSIQGSATVTQSLTIGTTSSIGSLVLHAGNTFTGTVRVASALGQNTVYVLPAVTGTIVEICTNAGNCIPNGNVAGDMLYWNGTNWAIIPAGNNGDRLEFCSGVPVWGGNASVSTTTVSGITDIGAISGGTITGACSGIIERGVVYATTTSPTIANSKAVSGDTTSTYTATMSGLSSLTTYYVRAYVTTSVGTVYGGQVSFMTAEHVYAIGETGPAGGKVFYDKGSYSSGWRYLEAASTDLSVGTFSWCASGTASSSVVTGGSGASVPQYTTIGYGSPNTGTADTACTGTVTNSMVKAAKAYTGGGYTDWFMPNLAELTELYNHKSLPGIGTFKTGYYWSSSEYDSTNAYCVVFSNGSVGFAGKAVGSGNGRAIRQF